MFTTHTDEVGKAVVACQSWWEENCVYLEPAVRESFVTAYSAAGDHKALVQGRADIQEIQDSWARITEFPNILFKAIQLPALSELEAKVLGITDKANS